jgi:hypothetical protein
MALRGASTTVDQDWIDWAELAAENAAVVCSVKALEAPRDYGNGEVAAVRARVIVLTGKHAGRCYDDERILKAGIRSKLTEVGDDIVGRVGVYGSRKAIGLEAEQAGDIALAEKALAKFAKGGSNGNGKVPTQRAKVEAVEEDDEPPF